MTYIPGNPWVICDISGRKVRMSDTRKMYNGLRVHWRYWCPQHPQEFMEGIVEHPEVKDARPRGTDVFISIGDVTADDL